MIFITLSGNKLPFNRVGAWIIALIRQGFLNPEEEEIAFCAPPPTIPPEGVLVYQSFDEGQQEKMITKARIVITDCHPPLMTLATRLAKTVIFIPRAEQLQENHDQHQVMTALELMKQNAKVAWSPGDLVRILAIQGETPISKVIYL